MSRFPSRTALLAAALWIAPCHLVLASESTPMQANGSFDVKVAPQAPDNEDAKSSGLSRLSINKRFHGPLDATSHGEMLASGDGKSGGAYVALETVTGTLDGRRGSFVLMHSAEMVGGAPRNWSVRVVAESGTDELRGLSGDMTIRIESGGKHFYDFSYRIDPPAG